LWPVGRMTTELLYSGPRLVNAAGGFFLKALRLSQLEVETCARILTILLSRPGRVSFLEMARLIPDCNPLVVIPQLRDLEGVVFLVKEPVGLSLTSDLRAELRFLMGYLPKAEPPPREEESYRLPQEPIPRNEYDILGVSPAAVLEEIKAAYRQKIKKCHPDHFVHLGKEMQCLAEEEAKVLNAAYATLSARHDRQANVSA